MRRAQARLFINSLRRKPESFTMQMAKLLPRPIDPQNGSDCASVMGALLAGVHLDRRRARALGWRGVRPSDALRPAWTCRVAGSGLVFGLVFSGESIRDKALHGEFGVFAFPPEDDAILDRFPLDALRLALHEGYEDMIRALSRHADELAPFRIGTVRLCAKLDGSGLGLSCSAPARQRMVALEGVAVSLAATAMEKTHAQTPQAAQVPQVPQAPQAAQAPQVSTDWLVKPGAFECDFPAFRLLLRFFAALIASAEAMLDETPRLRLHTEALPRRGFNAAGKLVPLPPLLAAKDHLLRLDALLGSAVQPEGGRALSRLPLRHKARPEENGARPVLHILTGFLGSGKTTFLRRWLDFLHGRERYTGVIQNEFGQIGLDAVLMQEDTRVEALDEGCVCCSLADSLRPGLQRLLADMPAEQFILETTGLANPANVLAALEELDDIILPGLVITVVDALALCAPKSPSAPDLAQSPTEGLAQALPGALAGTLPETLPGTLPGTLAGAQIERADVLIVNKADAVDEAALAALLKRLRACNSGALLLPARHGAIAFAELDAFYSTWLDQQGSRLPSQKPRLPHFAETRTHADEGYASLTLTFTAPVPESEVRRLVNEAGPGLCRAKGIVDILGIGPCVVQYAAGRLDFEPAPDLPEKAVHSLIQEREKTRYLVLIGKDLRRVSPNLDGNRDQNTERSGLWR